MTRNIALIHANENFQSELIKGYHVKEISFSIAYPNFDEDVSTPGNGIVSSMDFFCSKTASQIDLSTNAVILMQRGNWEHWLYLGIYLRFYLKRYNREEIPIIYCSSTEPNEFDYNNIANRGIYNLRYSSRGFYFHDFQSLFSQIEDDFDDSLLIDSVIQMAGLSSKNEPFGAEIFVDGNLHSNDRHSISNQWGAVRLGLAGGFTIVEIEYDYPQTLLFNYLLFKEGRNGLNSGGQNVKEVLRSVWPSLGDDCLIQFDEFWKRGIRSILGNDHKFRILYIDDNAEKGWANVLRRIINGHNITGRQIELEVVYDISNPVRKHYAQDRLDEYDLVLLDLYMPEASGERPTPKASMEWLKRERKKFPSVPIVLFTASNKKESYEQVLGLGADGMFVKSAPDAMTGSDGEAKKVVELVKVISRAIDKYRFIWSYWRDIDKILYKSKFRERIIETKNSNGMATRYADRIEERLKLFYLLLKKGYEQSIYEKNEFSLSNFDLAFLSLWSILIEIKSCWFESRKSLDLHGILISGIYKQTIEYHLNCFGAGSSRLFAISVISEDKSVKRYDVRCMVESKKDEAAGKYVYKFFDEVGDSSRKANSINEISLWIAFVLYHRLGKRSDVKFDNILIDVDLLLDDLRNCNKKRNNSFLIHGDEKLDSMFFCYTETEKAATNNALNRDSLVRNKDIYKLFRLIYCLLYY